MSDRYESDMNLYENNISEGAAGVDEQEAVVEGAVGEIAEEENLEGAVGYAPGYSGTVNAEDASIEQVVYRHCCEALGHDLMRPENERPITMMSFPELGIQVVREGEEILDIADGVDPSPNLEADLGRVLFTDENLTMRHYTEFARRLSYYIREVLDHQLPFHLSEIKEEVQKIRQEILVNTVIADAAEKDTKMSCVICMSDYSVGDSLRYLRCRHFFHRACIDKWLVEKPECPLCRRHLMHLVDPSDFSSNSE